MILKKHIIKLAVSLLAVSASVTISPVLNVCAEESLTSVPMYRLYNPNSGEHFYTESEYEKGKLVVAGWKDEGTAWFAPEKSDTPVYRLYNPNAGDHHYTTSGAEKDALKSAGWQYEGVGWYSDDNKTVPVYRQYNPNARTGAHNFTTNKGENNVLAAKGWKAEGIAWYGTNCTHYWEPVYETAEVPAETETVWVVDSPAHEAYDEPEYITKTGWYEECAGCGYICETDGDMASHMGNVHKDFAYNHWVKYGTYKIPTGNTIHHEAEEEKGHYEEKVIKQATTKQVLKGYKCRYCGATKNAESDDE